MEVDEDHIVLPSGRVVYANASIIGLSKTLEVTEGYDGSLDGADLVDPDRGVNSWSNWPAEDKVALAEVMIDRWNQYAERAKAEQASGR